MVETQTVPNPNAATGNPHGQSSTVGGIVSRSFKICTLPVLGGIPLHLHSFFLWYIVISTLLGFLHGVLYVPFNFLLNGVILFVTVLVHELGHCACTKFVGGTIDYILLWPLGGLAFVGHDEGPKQDAWVALAGPATHIPMTIFWVILVAVAGHGVVTLDFQGPLKEHFGMNLCVGALQINIAMFVFNLFVPAYPLDGGRVLANVLLHFGVEANKAAKITAMVSLPIAVVIACIGLWQLIVAGNFFGIIMVFIAAWVFYQAWILFQLAKHSKAADHPLFGRKRAVPYTQRNLPGDIEVEEGAVPNKV